MTTRKEIVPRGAVFLAIAFFFAAHSTAAQNTDARTEHSPPGEATGIQDTPPDASSEVGQWIHQLDDDQFDVREEATENLIGAGTSAVDPTATAAIEGSLEVTERAVRVLKALSLSTDVESSAAARAALTKLALSKNPAAARRARWAIRVHQRRLIAELERLGARLVFDENGMVTFVQMSGPNITDATLSRLNEFPDIRGLSLNRTKVTDAGLAGFQGLSKLETFAVIFTPITDKSVEYLKTVENASRLFLCGTKITTEGAQRLKDAMVAAKRDTNVDYRRGGLLGISGDPQAQICIAVNVLDNSAAAKAGIRPGDVILTCDGKKVGPFKSLTKLLAKKSPGDKVRLTIPRGEQTLGKEVILGSWQAD